MSISRLYRSTKSGPIVDKEMYVNNKKVIFEVDGYYIEPHPHSPLPVDKMDYLLEDKEILSKIADPRMDMATRILQLKQWLKDHPNG